MATHDYVLDNATGANFRSDLNNALAAIVSNNSSSSEPSTKYAYQWWADTSASILKIRNSSNDGWINLFTLAGGLDVDAASNFNEDVTFTGASANIVFDKSADDLIFNDNAKAVFGTSSDGLEIFHDASDSIINDNGTGSLKLQLGGSTKAEVVSGGLTVTGTVTATTFSGALSGNATTATTATNANHVSVADNESTNENNLVPFIEDASATGNVGLESDGDFHYNPSTGTVTATKFAGDGSALTGVSGTTINNNADNRVITGSDSSGTLNGESNVVIDSSSRLFVGKTASKNSDGDATAKAQIESTGNCMLDIAANGTTSSSYAGLNLIRSDGSSVNDHTAVDSGDRIGRINFIGADGSDRFNSCASIRAFAAADFSANNCPGYLTISTNSGGAAPTERVRFLSSGGMTFNGDTATANALDDYEEGTFTPNFNTTADNLTFNGGSRSNSSLYHSRKGSYTKIGRRVWFQISLSTTSLTAVGGSDFIAVDGLPFTAASESSTYPRFVMATMAGRFDTTNTFVPLFLVVNAGTTLCQVRQDFETQKTISSFNLDGSSNINVIECFGSYEVAS